MSSLVLAQTFTTRVEAELARLYLESEGIGAVLFDTEFSNYYGYFAAVVIPIRLMVLDEDLEIAGELLADDRAG